MKFIISIVAILLMILVHEWGHFIAGRICKVPVYEFAIGFGPKIFSRKGKKETIYSVRAIPLGGFCSFDSDDNTGTMDTSLNKQPPLKRIFIFIAGPLMNIITAFVILFSLCFAIGIPTPLTVIDSVTEGYDAYNVLKAEDNIIEANGIPLNGDSNKLYEIISNNGTNPINLKVERNNEIVEATISPKFNEDAQRYMIGIVQKQELVTMPFMKAIKVSNLTLWQYTVGIFDTLGGLITGKYSIKDMSSIVGIVDIMAEYASVSNIPIYLNLCALISVNLGIMNLLPIPVLDGSKVVFCLYEVIFKKRIPEKVEYDLTVAFMYLLFALSAYLMFVDIMRIVH